MISNTARITTKGLTEVFKGHIVSGSTIVADKASSYVRFAKDTGISLIRLKSETDGKKGIFNLQSINNYHKNLKGFMCHFNGVSSKFLNNYLVWNNSLTILKRNILKRKNNDGICLTTLLTENSKAISDREP